MTNKIVMVVALALWPSICLAQNPLLRIDSPADASVVFAGQTIIVSVSADPSVSDIAILGEDPIGFSQVTVSPLQFPLTIPPSTPVDQYEIHAVGAAGGQLIASEPITLFVERQLAAGGGLLFIQVRPSILRFRAPGEDMPLRVIATLVNGSRVDLSHSLSTTYASTDPSVVTVDNRGVVTAIAPGNAFLIVSSAGASATVSVKVLAGGDTIPPVTTARVSPTPNAAGWNNGNVTVTLSSIDNEPGGSGVKQISYTLSGAQTGSAVVAGSSAVTTISTEGTTTITYVATDNAGNQETPKTLTVQIDKTPPTVTWGTSSPVPNAAGWNNTDVSIPFTASDNLSGVATVSTASPLLLTQEGPAVTGVVTVTDKAGNSTTYTSPPVKIDKTPPSVACSVSPTSLWPPDHKMVTVTASVTVRDPLSGPDGFVLTAATSNEAGTDDIQGFVVGTASATGQLRAERSGTGNGRVYTLTYQGMDAAGNSATCSTAVTVPHDQR